MQRLDEDEKRSRISLRSLGTSLLGAAHWWATERKEVELGGRGGSRRKIEEGGRMVASVSSGGEGRQRNKGMREGIKEGTKTKRGWKNGGCRQ